MIRNESNIQPSERLKEALKQIQLRAQVRMGRTLTHGDLAELAGVSTRSLGDWMRGIYAPAGMSATLELLSQLDESDVVAVLDYWRNSSNPVVPVRTKRKAKSSKPGRSRKQAVATTRKKASSKTSKGK